MSLETKIEKLEKNIKKLKEENERLKNSLQNLISNSKTKNNTNGYAKLRSMFDASPLGLFYYDNNGVVRDCNSEFINIIGSKKENIIGQNIFDLPNETVKESVQKTLDGRKVPATEIEYSSVTSEKSTPVRVQFSPVFSPEGNIIGGFEPLVTLPNRGLLNQNSGIYGNLLGMECV